MADYKVNLNIYHGPMDLLLYLIKKEEVDIHSVPIASITQQYIEYVGIIRQIDPNISGEFLVLAATLLEIKTRSMLPANEAENAEDDDFSDPRIDLVRQLLEYKQFKDAARELDSLAEQRSMQFHRAPAAIEDDMPEIDMDDVQIWDLFEAFRSVMDAVGSMPGQREIIYDDTPQELHQMDILDRLERAGTVSFRSLFEGRNSRPEICGVFLAILELVRAKQILVKKPRGTAELQLELRPDRQQHRDGDASEKEDRNDAK